MSSTPFETESSSSGRGFYEHPSIKSFYSLWSIGYQWRASRHCDLQLSPWPRSMTFLCFLFHSLLSFATPSSAYLFFYIPEDSSIMWFSLLLLLLCVMGVQFNSIFFFISDLLLTSVEWFSIFLIFVVPCIMLHSGEISPTRCNNCVFYS